MEVEGVILGGGLAEEVTEVVVNESLGIRDGVGKGASEGFGEGRGLSEGALVGTGEAVGSPPMGDGEGAGARHVRSTSGGTL